MIFCDEFVAAVLGKNGVWGVAYSFYLLQGSNLTCGTCYFISILRFLIVELCVVFDFFLVFWSRDRSCLLPHVLSGIVNTLAVAAPALVADLMLSFC